VTKAWPALDVQPVVDGDEADLLLALVDDFSPTAVEEHETGVRIFFSTKRSRDAAIATLRLAHQSSREPWRLTTAEVPDEDWARRSQEGLAPVRVGRITIVPNPDSRITVTTNPEPRITTATNPESQTPNPDHLHLVIPPSMAFGTGHHATTRLCLAALQTLDLTGRVVIDVGTGSGVLALAAIALGAAGAFGFDNDPDAVAAARGNVAHNPALAGRVAFFVADFRSVQLHGDRHVVTANLTAALLIEYAAIFVRALDEGASLIVSGILTAEREAVVAAFGARLTVAWQRDEDGWTGLILMKNNCA
jgi:ribosomal protein L11 methyltransferase